MHLDLSSLLGGGAAVPDALGGLGATPPAADSAPPAALLLDMTFADALDALDGPAAEAPVGPGGRVPLDPAARERVPLDAAQLVTVDPLALAEAWLAAPAAASPTAMPSSAEAVEDGLIIWGDQPPRQAEEDHEADALAAILAAGPVALPDPTPPLEELSNAEPGEHEAAAAAPSPETTPRSVAPASGPVGAAFQGDEIADAPLDSPDLPSPAVSDLRSPSVPDLRSPGPPAPRLVTPPGEPTVEGVQESAQEAAAGAINLSVTTEYRGDQGEQEHAEPRSRDTSVPVRRLAGAASSAPVEVSAWPAARQFAAALGRAEVASQEADGAALAAARDANTAQLVQAMRVTGRGTAWEAVVRIRPDHLGPVTLSVRVDGTSVSATVDADAAPVRQWLEAQRDDVRARLEAHGLELDQFVVRRDGREQGGRDQDEQPRRPRSSPKAPAGDAPRFEITV